MAGWSWRSLWCVALQSRVEDLGVEALKVGFALWEGSFLM